MMAKRQTNRNFQIRNIIIGLFFCFVFYSFFYPRLIPQTFGSPNIEPTPTPRRATGAQPRRTKYSEFPHNIQAHRQACDSCHKFPTENWNSIRKGDQAFPDIADYPRHESCLNCHRQQFFRGAPPVICSVCHTAPSPRNNARHPFPNPREIFDLSAKGRNAVSDFAISFPHDKHIEIVSQNENGGSEIINAALTGGKNKRFRSEESCAVCHQTYQPQGETEDEYFTTPPAKLGDAFWLKKGTFKTLPISHAKCFTCHSTDTGILPAPSNCAACHKIKPTETRTDFDAKVAAAMKITDKITLTSWRKRDSSATFRHEFSSHAELDCAACHNVSAMNTLDAKTKKVSVASCSPCHITDTSDDGGILNFEIDSRKTNANFKCAKCHLAFGKAAIPESHLKAIPTQAGK